MASAPDAEPREVEFRRRWYEAHARRAQAEINQGHYTDTMPDFLASGAEALEIRNRLASSGDLDRFKTEQDAWAREHDVGFKGPIGAMFINSLVNNTDDCASLARLLVSGLTAPTNRESAAQKIDALVDHVNRIRVGAHPAPASAAFVLSFFWGLEQPRGWPTYWPNDRRFLAASTGTKFLGSPSERYLGFVDLVAELDEDCQRFATVSTWWAEKQPSFLDPVLVDRCAYGIDPETIPPEALRDNALALVGIAGHLGQSLVDDVSEALGYRCEVTKPSLDWKEGRPRADLWAGWHRKSHGPRLWLWVNHRVAAIGIVPTSVRKGWIDEARDVVASNPVDGFTLMATRGASHGKDMGFMGRQGSFIYGRYYESDQLADLDLRAEILDVASAARPLLDALTSQATDGPPPPKPRQSNGLADAVAEFRRDTAYPTAHDERQKARQPRLREILRPDRLATTDRAELRRVWTGAYGGAGAQSYLGRTVRDADEVEYERILKTLEYLCWGDGDDADRIDRVLTDPDHKVKGLGETVVFKLLAICHPDRYLCVYPYSGGPRKAADAARPRPPGTPDRSHPRTKARRVEQPLMGAAGTSFPGRSVGHDVFPLLVYRLSRPPNKAGGRR